MRGGTLFGFAKLTNNRSDLLLTNHVFCAYVFFTSRLLPANPEIETLMLLIGGNNDVTSFADPVSHAPH